jgi:hypothetical protein
MLIAEAVALAAQKNHVGMVFVYLVLPHIQQAT